MLCISCSIRYNFHLLIVMPHVDIHVPMLNRIKQLIPNFDFWYRFEGVAYSKYISKIPFTKGQLHLHALKHFLKMQKENCDVAT